MKALLETGQLVFGPGMVEVEIDLPFHPLWCFLDVQGTSHCGGPDGDTVLYSLDTDKLILAGMIKSDTATVKWLVLGAHHEE